MRAFASALFLGRARVCRIETTVLSKSSTLTRFIVRKVYEPMFTSYEVSGKVCFWFRNSPQFVTSFCG
jgi:hypothetical protein